MDHMGQDEEAPGTDAIKFPRGMLDYALLLGPAAAEVAWKMTGDLGGEAYRDQARGPRNEGRHVCGAVGVSSPRCAECGLERGESGGGWVDAGGGGLLYDEFRAACSRGRRRADEFCVFNTTASVGRGSDYRCQLLVNGYQFGKHVNKLGPQTVFPVPEGILNHNGENDIALTLWALDAEGARVGGLELMPQRVIKSGYSKPGLSPMPGWTPREGAY